MNVKDINQNSNTNLEIMYSSVAVYHYKVYFAVVCNVDPFDVTLDHGDVLDAVEGRCDAVGRFRF